jgi:hypothetical protein
MDYTSRNYNNPLYNTWKDMRKRCSNPNRRDYKWYGGKGIIVCDKWQTFSGFLEDMLETYFPGATINRKDSSLGYYKDNCDWKTLSEQQLTRSNVYRRWERLEEMQALRRQGFTYKVISEKLDLPFGTVNWYLSKYGT